MVNFVAYRFFLIPVVEMFGFIRFLYDLLKFFSLFITFVCLNVYINCHGNVPAFLIYDIRTVLVLVLKDAPLTLNMSLLLHHIPSPLPKLKGDRYFYS